MKKVYRIFPTPILCYFTCVTYVISVPFVPLHAPSPRDANKTREFYNLTTASVVVCGLIRVTFWQDIREVRSFFEIYPRNYCPRNTVENQAVASSSMPWNPYTALALDIEN